MRIYHLVLTGLMIGLGSIAMAQTKVDHAFMGRVVDSLQAALARFYVYPDTVAARSAYLKKRWREGAYDTITQPDVLAQRLQEDVQQVYRDKHFMLLYQPGVHLPSGPAPGRLAAERKENFWFKRVEILPGNIGYIAIDGFTSFQKEADTTVMAAFRFVAHTRALILDLRYNNGGSPFMVNRVEAHFFPHRTHLNDIVDRVTGKTDTMYTDPAKAQGVILTIPVYLLTSSLTFSGGEDFAYALQSVRRAVIVGESTGGGAHAVRPFLIGLGYIAGIPFARALNPYTHTDWEAVGVQPDIPVAADSALIAAEKAIDQKDPWSLDELLGRQAQQTPDTAVLKTYEGAYGPLTFFHKGTAFYCRNADMGGYVQRVFVIGPDVFTLNDDAHVRFLQNTQQAVLLWRGGGQDTLYKSTTSRREK